MTRRRHTESRYLIEDRIDNLIREWARTLPPEAFQDALDEPIVRASAALETSQKDLTQTTE